MSNVAKITRRTLRLKEELDKKINQKAKECGVSVNAYISLILSKEVTKGDWKNYLKSKRNPIPPPRDSGFLHSTKA